MKVVIKGSGFNGSPLGYGGIDSVHAPASKSSMQRACAAALVRKGESIIRNPGKSNDDIAGLNVIKALGATVNKNEDGSLQVLSEGVKPGSSVVNNGEAGL